MDRRVLLVPSWFGASIGGGTAQWSLPPGVEAEPASTTGRILLASPAVL